MTDPTPATPEVTTDTTPEEVTGQTSIDMDAALDTVTERVFGDEPAPTTPEATADPSSAAGKPAAAPTAAAPTDKTPPLSVDPDAEPPKSWKKEMHAHWTGLPKEAKDYIRQREKQMLDGLETYKGDAGYGKGLREAMTPFQPIIKAAGLDDVGAVKTLLTAHYRLTQGPMEQRRAAYEQLGKNLGLTASPQGANGQQQTGDQEHPAIAQLRQTVDELKHNLTAREQEAYESQRAERQKEVDAFASDTAAHPYFEEVADYIVGLLHAARARGQELSLQDAYDQAVYANPVTRQKEIDRLQTEAISKHRENARLDALPKKKAAGINVKGKEPTVSAPTEPLGSLRDTVRDAMADIKARGSA